MGILLAILSSLSLGIGNFVLKKSYQDLPSSIAFFFFSLCSLILFGISSFFFGINFSQIGMVFIYAFISAFFAQAVYFYVLSKGEISITGTIIATFSVYTVIFSFFFLHETLTTLQLLFVILAVIGIIILSLPNKFNTKEFKKIRYVGWGVFGALSIGLSDTITKGTIHANGVGTFLFCVAIAQFLISFIYLKFENQSLSQFFSLFSNWTEYKYSFIGGVLIVIGTLFFFIALNTTNVSIASPIVASSPIYTVILALTVLKEKLTKRNIIGLIITIISVIGLGFFVT